MDVLQGCLLEPDLTVDLAWNQKSDYSWQEWNITRKWDVVGTLLHHSRCVWNYVSYSIFRASETKKLSLPETVVCITKH